MIHIKKTILTLALLIAATTQAWAGDPKQIGLNVEYGVGDVITSTSDAYINIKKNGDDLYGIKVTSTQSLTISQINKNSFTINNSVGLLDLANSGAQLKDGTTDVVGYEIFYASNSASTPTMVHLASGSGTLKDPYVFAPGPAPTVTTVPLIPTEGKTNEWTIKDGMPAGNVTVTPEYFKQAEFTAGGAPAAVEGVLAKTGAPLVTGGTVANIGTSDVKQGKVMYYAKQKSGETVPTAPTYESAWSENVPNSNDFTEGEVYVWYYIKGAEPATVAERIDDNTCSDSDIKRLTVTLDAPPTYDVVINTAGLSAEEAGKWSASPNTDVKKGDEVTVTYTGSRKVIGVKAEKMGPTYKKWDKDQKKLVATEIPATATKVENYNCDDSWDAGTYLVEGDVTIDGYIHLYGDVELIIKDGAKLTAHLIDGFNGISNYSLSIYGQTKMSGELNIACGGEAICNMTALNIHSCKVNAISSNSRCCGGFYN